MVRYSLLLLAVALKGDHPVWIVHEETSCDAFAEGEERLDASTTEILNDVTEYLNNKMRWKLPEQERKSFAVSLGGEKSATFGYILKQGAANIIRQFRRRTRGRSLLDLGSGAGHMALFGAVIARNVSFRGVELSDSRSNVALSALDFMNQSYPELNLPQRVRLEQGDMLSATVNDVDAIYISSLALGDTLRTQLAHKLVSECRPGTVRPFFFSSL